jgi:thiamine-phosphate pyrophosphorylase
LANISQFHYITQDLPDISHAELIEIACEAGVRWVQLRAKNKPYDEWLQIAEEARSITIKYEAILVINDNLEIARQVYADGVHLGRNDMPVREARKIAGPDMIIGGTANTLEDVLSLQEQGADYIGLGPFRFTSTKENLSPLLGLSGYEKLSTFNFQFSIPVIAIGGIQVEDVQPLLQTGIHGVAVSSAINLANDKPAAVRKFLGQFSFTSK